MRLRAPLLLPGVFIGAALIYQGVSAQSPPPPDFTYLIHAVSDTGPGQRPMVTFSVVDAAGGPYDLATHPAFTQLSNGASRLALQIGWNSREYTNEGSGSETATVGAGAALPISIDVLRLLAAPSPLMVANPDGTYTATSGRALPASLNGSGTVALEGHPAGQDPMTGLWTVRVPVTSVYRYFAITDPAPTARRTVVDVAKCKRCHGVLSTHGFNRTDEPKVCVICHNANATDIPYRRFGDGPEESIDFKRMIHGIHAAKMRHNPLVIIGFNHSVNDFSHVDFPGELSKCVTCHVDGTFELPLRKVVLGSTVDTRSTMTETSKVVDGDPANDLNISPTAAVCSSCHDGREAIEHMKSKGASFATTQARIDSGRVRERCARCHGPGKPKDVRKVHHEEDGEDD